MLLELDILHQLYQHLWKEELLQQTDGEVRGCVLPQLLVSACLHGPKQATIKGLQDGYAFWQKTDKLHMVLLQSLITATERWLVRLSPKSSILPSSFLGVGRKTFMNQSLK
jgi:hypothetical protein